MQSMCSATKPSHLSRWGHQLPSSTECLQEIFMALYTRNKGVFLSKPGINNRSWWPGGLVGHHISSHHWVTASTLCWKCRWEGGCTNEKIKQTCKQSILVYYTKYNYLWFRKLTFLRLGITDVIQLLTIPLGWVRWPLETLPNLCLCCMFLNAAIFYPHCMAFNGMQWTSTSQSERRFTTGYVSKLIFLVNKCKVKCATVSFQFIIIVSDLTIIQIGYAGTLILWTQH